MTEERARNAKDARGDGDSSSCDRLEGVISKTDDWHAIRLAYQVRTSASEIMSKEQIYVLETSSRLRPSDIMMTSTRSLTAGTRYCSTEYDVSVTHSLFEY